MTQITKLFMKGFKSFAKPTTIDLTTGFNCILGPNGAGKSNVLDALCFVLGRSSSKSLRVEKSANLIYNGGPTKKPMDRGEVSIFFDNGKKTFPIEGNEIKISRIVKPDGASVYKINDKSSSRNEIIELLNNGRIDPDGYNIVLQGDIIRFCEMHPVERRKIIEEVSNISQYEDKKEKAMGELTKTEEKLNEADIIMKERKSRLRDLEHERNQALKYKEAEDQIKLSKAAYLKKNHSERNDKFIKLNTEIEGYKTKITAINQKIDEKNAKIAECRNLITGINNEINEKGEKEQVTIHKEIEEIKVNIATGNTKLNNINTNTEKLNERIVQLQKDKENLLKETEINVKEIDDNKEYLANLNRQLTDIEKKLSEIRSKSNEQNIEQIEKEMNELDSEIEKHQRVISDISLRQQNLFREKDQLEFQLENLNKQIDKMKEVEKESKAQLESLKKIKDDFKTTTLKLNDALNKDSDYGAQIGNAKVKLNYATNELSKLEQKQLHIMENSANTEAMKEISALKQKFSGIHGTISHLGKVESKFATALEVASGNKLSFFIVDDESIAIKCINHLKERKAGTASFIPLNKIKANDTAVDKKILSMPGVHGRAIDLIRFDHKYDKAFSYVFGNTIVADNLEIAKKIGIGSDYKVVTIEGDIAERSGVMKGGFRQKKQSLFELSQINEEVDKMNSEVANNQAIIEKLQNSRLMNENDIVSLRHKKSELEGEIIKLEKTLHISDTDLDATGTTKKDLNEKLKRVDADLEAVRSEITAHNIDMAKIKSRKEILRNSIQSLRNPKILAELNAFDEKKTKLKEDAIKTESLIANTLSHKELKEKELEKISAILKQHDKELKAFRDNSLAVEKQLKEFDKILKEKEKSAKDFYTKYKELFSKREKYEKEVLSVEKQIEDFRNDSKTNEIKSNMLSLELAKINTELSGLSDQIAEFTEIVNTRAEEVEKKMAKSQEDLKKEVSHYERILSEFGLVNLKSLEIYDQAKSEYDELVTKRALLDDEKVKVLTLINEIETKKTSLFMDAYGKIDSNFKEIFKLLAPKGEAHLHIEDPKHLFEDGVTIKVKLGESKTLDIRSLSGGEKTLTALSFIFALQEYAPHSFYILDEVDAALDKYNSEKLAKLIRKYTSYAQYIIISHNDAIMAEADALYGVSMDNHNISKVTSLRM